MLRSELLDLLDENGIERNEFHPKESQPLEPNSEEVDEELKQKVLDALREHEAKEVKKEL